MKDKVIEAMKSIIADKGYTMWGKCEAILNLRYVCEKCGGSGFAGYYCQHERVDCPSCNGTGKGERMLAIVDRKGKVIE